mmetsp:Transcript_173248/g.555663  ORF Transcript_173248/g.555663 Transcript_173248/m.555663 type:complete len:310 (+) Transcript_173248:3473-4402(+)
MAQVRVISEVAPIVVPLWAVAARRIAPFLCPVLLARVAAGVCPTWHHVRARHILTGAHVTGDVEVAMHLDVNGNALQRGIRQETSPQPRLLHGRHHWPTTYHLRLGSASEHRSIPRQSAVHPPASWRSVRLSLPARDAAQSDVAAVGHETVQADQEGRGSQLPPHRGVEDVARQMLGGWEAAEVWIVDTRGLRVVGIVRLGWANHRRRPAAQQEGRAAVGRPPRGGHLAVDVQRGVEGTAHAMNQCVHHQLVLRLIPLVAAQRCAPPDAVAQLRVVGPAAGHLDREASLVDGAHGVEGQVGRARGELLV